MTLLGLSLVLLWPCGGSLLVLCQSDACLCRTAAIASIWFAWWSPATASKRRRCTAGDVRCIHPLFSRIFPGLSLVLVHAWTRDRVVAAEQA